MPSTKEIISDKAIAVLVQGDAPLRQSKIPAPLRFPLLAVLSLVLSTFLYSFMEGFTAGELAGVSRTLDQWWQVGALLGWRIFELGLGWFGDFDGYDIAALSLLSHGPPLYLLATFYEISTTTVLSSLIIDAIATYIPFRILRPLSLAHSATTSSRSRPVPNSDILVDLNIQLLETVLAASIYSVTIYTSYKTFLPTALATYFDGIPSVAAAHSASYVSMLPITFFLGVAAKSFIFTPAVVAVPTSDDAKNAAFDPATATLSETFFWNVWGYGARTKVVLKRTLTLMLVSGVNTFVQTWVSLEGVEAWGASAYSAIWVVAAGTTGAALGLVSAA